MEDYAFCLVVNSGSLDYQADIEEVNSHVEAVDLASAVLDQDQLDNALCLVCNAAEVVESVTDICLG